MDIALLFLIIAVAGIGGKAFAKLCSNMITQNSVPKYTILLMVNSIVACVFFFISGGFKVSVNLETLMFAFVFALGVTVSVISNVVIYRYASISGVSILSSTLSVFTTAVIGWTLFSESFGLRGVLRIATVFLAAAVEFINQIKNAGKRSGKSDPRKTLPLVLMIAVISITGCVTTITVKLFAMSETVTDNNSFFFLTNAVLLIGASIVFIISCFGKKEEFKGAISLLYPKKIVSIAGNTVCSNISSLTGALILSRMAVSIYSPINFTIGILTGLVGSLLFRERFGVLSYVAAAIACVAMFI